MATGYVFRDDLAADKANQQDLAMQGMAPPPAPTLDPNQSQAPAVSAPANPQANAFSGLAKTMQATAPKPPAAPAQDQNPFAQFSAALEAQNPFKNQLQQGVSQTLSNPYGAIDASNAAARDKAALEANAAAEERRSQGITAYGGNATGQATRDLNRFKDQRLLNDQRFELDAAANREAAGEVARGNAINQGLGILGESRQGAQSLADLSQRQTELAASERQAELGRQSQEKMSAAQLASQEKISYANLSLEEKRLVQQADQYTNELDFKKAALANGNDQAAIDRAWNASQNAEERAAREKIANAQIGSTERLQASQQAFQSAESKLQRGLDSMMQNERIQAQFDLANLDNTFQEKLQKTGYLQTKDLQQMKQDFETSLTDKGIAADIAKQLSDQKFQMMKAENDHAFDASQNLLNQQWQTGERIGAQDWTSSLKTLEMKHDDLVQERDIAAKQGLQTQSIDAEIKKTQLQIASQELMASAQLAQNDKEWQQEFLLKKGATLEDIRQSRIKLNDDLATSLINREGLGLQNDVARAALANGKVQSAMELATWGMEMGDGSPEAMAPFVASIGAALSTALKDQGVNLTPEQIEKMIGASGVKADGTGGTGTTGAVGTNESYENFQSHLDDVASTFPSSVNIEKVDSIGKQMATSKPGSWPYQVAVGSKSNLWNAPGADKNFTKVVSPGSSTNQIFSKTQEGNDYLWLQKFMDEGLTESQAIDLASKAIGKDRILAAYKAINGKEFTGSSAVKA